MTDRAEEKGEENMKTNEKTFPKEITNFFFFFLTRKQAKN